MKTFFLKYEWIFLILALAFLLTIVPMMISAPSWLLVILGFAYVAGWILWIVNKVSRTNIDL